MRTQICMNRRLVWKNASVRNMQIPEHADVPSPSRSFPHQYATYLPPGCSYDSAGCSCKSVCAVASYFSGTFGSVDQVRGEHHNPQKTYAIMKPTTPIASEQLGRGFSPEAILTLLDDQRLRGHKSDGSGWREKVLGPISNHRGTYMSTERGVWGPFSL